MTLRTGHHQRHPSARERANEPIISDHRELLTEVFDGAWAELQASDCSGIADEAAARDMLARRIIASAIKLGARDPEKLKSMALQGLIH